MTFDLENNDDIYHFNELEYDELFKLPLKNNPKGDKQYETNIFTFNESEYEEIFSSKNEFN